MRTIKTIKTTLGLLSVDKHCYIVSRRELPVTVTVRKPFQYLKFELKQVNQLEEYIELDIKIFKRKDQC